MTGRALALWYTCALAFGLALALLAPFDLPLSSAVAKPEAELAVFVLAFGELPGWGLIAWSLSVLALAPSRARLHPLRPLAQAILLQATLLPLLVTQTLKLLWGRVRFVHLARAADFTPFWVPAGPGAGMSFPSGHVAMASLGAAVVFFALRERRQRLFQIALPLAAGWSLLVAWGRILAGAHYLSDCLFSLGLAWLLAPWLFTFTSRALRKGTDAPVPYQRT